MAEKAGAKAPAKAPEASQFGRTAGCRLVAWGGPESYGPCAGHRESPLLRLERHEGEIVFELPQVETQGYFFISSPMRSSQHRPEPQQWHVGSSRAQALNATSIASCAYCLGTLKAEVTVRVSSVARFGTAAARIDTDRRVHCDRDRRGHSEPRARGSKRQFAAQAS